MPISLRFAATAAFVLVIFGGAISGRLAAQEQVEDTVVADDDSRPLFERGAKPANEPAEPVQTRTTRLPRASAKNRFAVPDPALELADPRTYQLKIGIHISAPESPAKTVVATAPIPMDWPEQKVRLLSEKKSPHVRMSEEIQPGQAALMKLQVAQIPKGGTAFVERLYEVTRYRTKFKLPADDLKLPRTNPIELRDQLNGTSPGMEIHNQKMIDLANLLNSSSRDEGAWATAKSFWSWTRENVKFENGDFRGAMHAIEHRCGDCEEMSALFVGLCRLSNIPARTVWVYSHDYPEFYLVDQQGKGHWIPAQVLGPAWFGEMAEYRPILQKGDRFFDPLRREYVRYVPQTMRGADAKVQPLVEFTHEIIADSDINGPGYGPQ